MRIGEIVADDFAERGTAFGHGSRTTLTESNSVALTGPFQNYRPLFLSRRKVVAGHRIPAEAAIDGKPPGLAFANETSRFLL